MWQFVFKKSFLDLWDNFPQVLVLNLGVLALATAGLAVQVLVPGGWFLAYLPVGLVLWHWLGAWFWASLERVKVSPLRWARVSLALGVANFILLYFGSFSINFYFSLGGVLNLTLGLLVFWVWLSWLAGSLFAIGEGVAVPKVRRALKVSFHHFFQQPVRGLAVWLISGLALASTVLLVFGWGLALILIRNYRLTLLTKQAFLAQQPNHRGRLPWKDLLRDEEAKLGKRQFFSWLFPRK